MYTLPLSLPLLLLVSNGASVRMKDNYDLFDQAMESQLREALSPSHRGSLKEIPFDQEDSSSCPSHCVELRGDGHCDQECNTSECLFDFSDCSSLPFHSGRKEFFWAILPSVNPHKFYAHFTKSENCLERQLGFKVALQADADGPIIFGRSRDKQALVHMKWPRFRFRRFGDQFDSLSVQSDEPIKESFTLALFSLNTTSLVREDTEDVMDLLSKLGSPLTKAKIIPFTLRKEEVESLFLPEEPHPLLPHNLLIWTRRHREDDKIWAEEQPRCKANHRRRRRYVVEEEEVDLF